MDDIAPKLLEALRKDFDSNMDQNAELHKLLERINSGKGNYEDAGNYAYEVGNSLASSFEKNLSSAVLPDGKMYYNIAERTIKPMLEADHKIVNDVSMTVQTYLNQKAGIGIKAQPAPVDSDGIENIINKIVSADRFNDVAWLLIDPVKTFSQAVVDSVLERNIRFQGEAGLSPSIVRRAEHKCCEWCARLAGKYTYPGTPHDVFRRHNNCRCVVDYHAGNGKVQNIHTKKWQDKNDDDIIKTRKTVGIKSTPMVLAEHPKRLASFTPETLKDALEREGFEIKNLKRGSLKDIPFDEGGGFKVNFEDGGILQYHPSQNSHHDGAYYKISTGKGGRHRYDLEGNEKKD